MNTYNKTYKIYLYIPRNTYKKNGWRRKEKGSKRMEKERKGVVGGMGLS